MNFTKYTMRKLVVVSAILQSWQYQTECIIISIDQKIGDAIF